MSSAHNAEEELRILLIGKSRVGKSSTGNTILGKTYFPTSSLRVCTTTEDEGETQHIGGRWGIIKVTDTPGLSEDNCDLDNIIDMINSPAPGPHVIILVLQIGRYTEEDQLTVDYYLNLFGEDIYKHLIVLFTGRNELEDDHVSFDDFIKDHIPQHLSDVLKKCDYIAFDNTDTEANKKRDTDALLKMIGQKQTFVFKRTLVEFTDSQHRILNGIIKKLHSQSEEEAKRLLKRRNNVVNRATSQWSGRKLVSFLLILGVGVGVILLIPYLLKNVSQIGNYLTCPYFLY